jgi:hypothetical protein
VTVAYDGPMRCVVVLVIAASAAVADARDADACVPPLDGVQNRRVLPGDDATGVPRNAQIHVFYDGVVPEGTLSLRVAGGDVVDVTTTGTSHVVLAPAAELAASTTYEVVDTLTVPCDGKPSACVGEPIVVATFTTGVGVDARAPAIEGVAWDSTVSCTTETCEDVANEAIDRLMPTIDDDFAAWIVYEYLDERGAVIAGPTTSTTAGRTCGGGHGYFQGYIHVETPAVFRMRAIDLAGHVGAASDPIFGGTCEYADGYCAMNGGEPDGGGDDDGGGCSTASGAAGLWLLALIPRRRRRGRGTPPARACRGGAPRA